MLTSMAKPSQKSPHGTFDQPIPDWIPPCLPTLVERPPVGAKWQHEVKWDGYRVSAYLDEGQATIRTRNGHDWTHRFPAIVASVEALPIHNAVIDGEAVVLDEAGKSDFGRLQAALGTSGRGPDKRKAEEAVLYAFDLLFLDGHDLRPWALIDRRAALETIVGPSSPAILFSEAFTSHGAELFAAAMENGLEGIVSKRADLPYTSGRRETGSRRSASKTGRSS